MAMRKSILIFVIIAILGLISGFFMVYLSQVEVPPPPIPFLPAQSPYTHFVAAQGLVEGGDENIRIGSPYSEIIEEVFVEAGDQVKVGDPLFRLVDISLKKELASAERNYDIALANYQRQLALPRAEEIPPLEYQVVEDRASYADAVTRFKLYQQITNPKSISIDEYNTRRFATLTTKAALEISEARLALSLAGAWDKDLAIYKAELALKNAQVEITKTQLERYTIRASVDGVVLQSNIHPGEFVSALDSLLDAKAYMILGRLDTLQVRVYVNEEETWRVLSHAPATAFVRGNKNISVPLNFIRIEPYLVSKTEITGSPQEVIDTRVLPVIYHFKRNDLPIYPGEVLDVFLEAKPQLTTSP